MGYLRIDCRAGVFTLLDTLPCSLLVPCGTDNQDYENHLYVDCPGVAQVARGLRTSSSSYALLADEVKRSQEIGSEQGIGGCDFNELSGSFACPRPWMNGEPPSVLDLKHAKEFEDDFNNDVFSLVCSVVDDPDGIAMAARE